MMTDSKSKWREDKSTYSGETIKLFNVKCECGHTLSFISNHYKLCNHCGRKVYPTKRSEFKDKLLKEIKKK